jgi:hypothetical protein
MGENPTAEVELDGETIIVKKDEYGYVAVEKKPTEKEQFIEYLQQHDQVVEFDDFDNVINIHYENTAETGYNNHTENVLLFEDYESVEVKYLERDSTVENADTFVQVDVSNAE